LSSSFEGEALLRSLSDFVQGLGRYHYLTAILGGAPGSPDPAEAFQDLRQLLVELSKDPEDEDSTPELLTIAAFGTQRQLHEQLSERLLTPVVEFAQDVSQICHYFSPITEPAALAYLTYVRWPSEPPARWNEPQRRRPRQWLDGALQNERWRSQR